MAALGVVLVGGVCGVVLVNAAGHRDLKVDVIRASFRISCPMSVDSIPGRRAQLPPFTTRRTPESD